MTPAPPRSRGPATAASSAPAVEDFDLPPISASRCPWPIDFEITRITLPLIATALIAVLARAATRKLRSCPASCSSSARAATRLVRDGIARDIIGPECLPFAPFLASLFFFILVNNVIGIIPFVQIPPIARFAFPLVLAVIIWRALQLGRHPGAGRRQLLQGRPVPAGRARRC